MLDRRTRFLLMLGVLVALAAARAAEADDGTNSTAAASRTAKTAYKDWMLGPFTKPEPPVNPILGPNFDTRCVCPLGNKPVRWESRAIIGGAAVVQDGKVRMIYHAEDDAGGYRLRAGGSPGTMRMGLAESLDGLLFTRRPEPVLGPGEDRFKPLEWPGGCEIPRLVEGPDGIYVLFYDGWNKQTARLLVATSKDLTHWTKHGSPFTKAHGQKYANTWSKSAAVVTELRDGRLVAARIKGRYWMYWGEEGLNIATSENLTDWTMLEDASGQMRRLIPPRPGMFDDRVIEGGAAVMTGRGIVVIYNTFRPRRHTEPGDAILASGLGQALVDRDDPTRALDRSDAPFLVPDREYELQGSVNNVVFATGLVRFQGKWFLYHNGGDRMLCVAVADAAGGGP